MKAQDPYVVALRRAATLDHQKLQPHQLHKSKAKAATLLSRLGTLCKPQALIPEGVRGEAEREGLGAVA